MIGLTAKHSKSCSGTNKCRQRSASKYFCIYTHHVSSVVTGEWIDGEDNNDVANAGETLTRTYSVTNGGTTTLSSLCVTDEKFGADCLACTVSDDGELPPGESFVCTIPSVVSCSRRGQRSSPAPFVELVCLNSDVKCKRVGSLNVHSPVPDFAPQHSQ